MQILAGIILLAVLIVFHELGHFLFAKWLGVRVLVFSVGFGPKIWGFKHGETEYRLSAIPLGGYVRMFGESLDDNLTDAEKKISFMHQPIWRKSLIAFAGPLFNFILPVILFFFLLFGTEQVARPKVGTILKGGVAELAGIKVGDEIISVNNDPVISFSDVADRIANNPNIDLDLVIRRKDTSGKSSELTIRVRPETKTSTNPLEKNLTQGRIGIMPSVEMPIILVSDHSPFRASGLLSFDEIVSLDGEAIGSASDLVLKLETLKTGQQIEAVRNGQSIKITVPEELGAQQEEKAITMTQYGVDQNFSEVVRTNITGTEKILREEATLQEKYFGISPANGAIDEVQKDSVAEKLNLAIEDRLIAVDGEKLSSMLQLQQALMHDPTSPHVLGVMKKDGTPQVVVFAMGKDAEDKMTLNTDLLSILGVDTVQVFKSGEIIERNVGLMEAIRRAVMQTFDIAFMTAKSLWLLVKMEVPASQIGGPIMLFDVAQQAAQKGLPYYIFVMCLLSVNLGLLNLLPIPALDGGHLLLFGIEAVQRKPLTSRTRMIATQIGIAFLLALMAFAIFNDLSRLFR